MAEGYPPYTVTFNNDGGVQRLSGAFGTGVPGSHSLRMTVPGGVIRLELTHNDEQADTEPTLRLRIIDEPNAPDGPKPTQRRATAKKAAKKSPKKAAKKRAKKAPKRAAKKAARKTSKRSAKK